VRFYYSSHIFPKNHYHKAVIKSAEYISSYVDVRIIPTSKLPEYAFIGRSNVGKSSLINMLTGRKSLAHVSHTPGKTQAVNFFLINNTWHLVDLPGYGYARISKKMRARWEHMIRQYFTEREELINVYLLIDIRIPPQKIDLEFANTLGEIGVPFSIIYTKADKMKKTHLENSQNAFKEEMLKSWSTMPDTFLSSSATGLGKEDILKHIDKINKSLEKLK